jgi:anti-sigma B factor antagonist/stage II sporulation protein AA (anti-sigma F factor antagonist)
MTVEDWSVVVIEHGPLTIRSSRQEDEHVVALEGELDLAGVQAVQDEMRRVEAADARRIVVDLSGLEFMDSTGLRTMLQIDARSRANGERVVFLRGGPPVQRLFTTTGTEGRLPFID